MFGFQSVYSTRNLFVVKGFLSNKSWWKVIRRLRLSIIATYH